jgi:cob(I)alamin adenosyltransferase
VAQLDDWLAHYNAALPRLAEFILPGGSRPAAQAHICRTVCRRAERALVELGAAEALNEAPRQYLNRLSDLLFVLARAEPRGWRERRALAARAGILKVTHEPLIS